MTMYQEASTVIRTAFHITQYFAVQMLCFRLSPLLSAVIEAISCEFSTDLPPELGQVIWF